MSESVDPFGWVPSRLRKKLLAICFIATLVVWIALLILDINLQGGRGPLGGIVALQFAQNLESVERLLASWKEPGRVLAAFHLGLDYLFIVLYAMSLALVCAVVSGEAGFTRPWVAKAGVIVAWGVFAAGALDAVENAALLSLIRGSQDAALPVVGTWCATAKFILLVVAVAFLAAVKVSESLHRVKRRLD